MQNPNPVNPTFLVEMLKKNIFSRKLRCHELFSQETEPLLGEIIHMNKQSSSYTDFHFTVFSVRLELYNRISIRKC